MIIHIKCLNSNNIFNLAKYKCIIKTKILRILFISYVVVALRNAFQNIVLNFYTFLVLICRHKTYSSYLFLDLTLINI